MSNCILCLLRNLHRNLPNLMGMHTDLMGCQVKQLRQSLSPLFCFPAMNLNSSSKLGSPRIWAYATHVKWVSPVRYGVPKRTCPLVALLCTPYSNTLLIPQKFNATKTQKSWGSACYFSSCKISIEKYERQHKRARGKDSRNHSPAVRCYQAAIAAQLLFLQTL